MNDDTMKIEVDKPLYCFKEWIGYYKNKCHFFIRQIDEGLEHYGSCGYSCVLKDHWFDMDELHPKEKPLWCPLK